ncbi:MAG: class I adenylate-forming enzyme family protein [bacterium]|nr:class I adenylate-forming enzyme family protein [bacterium]
MQNDDIKNLHIYDAAKDTRKKVLVGKPSIDKPWLKYYTQEQKDTDMPKMSTYQYLYDCNKKYLGRTALNYFGKKITFQELFENIDKTARAFKAMGVKENDIVTISLPNIPEAVYMFYALSKIGAIANMVDPRTSDKGIEGYVREVNSDLLVIIDSYYNKVKKLSENGVVDNIITVSPADSLPFGINLGYKAKEFIESMKDPMKKNHFNDSTINWTEFIKQGNSYSGKVEADYIPNRPVVIEHTGGTTGKPKGVMLSNENINAVALQSVLTGIDMKREHNWLDIMPPFIAYGVGMGLHLPLTIGMETILIPQFDAKKFDELLLKHKPIHMVGVPSYWGTIINSKKLAKKDLSYMIAPTVGGDAMDTTLEQESNEFLKEHNCTSKITKGYGMTEVTGGVAGTGTLDENNLVGSVGIPFVKTTISIFDPETSEELGYNQNGEVCITGPNTMLGYYNNDEATSDMLKKHSDGQVWVHSGDIGYMTEDGNLFIVDRLKRMIIRYDGFKVFPSMIENVISSHNAVESCKVVGIPDDEHSQGKLPKAHVVLKDEYKFNSEIVQRELEELCSEKLPEYSQPVAYKMRNCLPLTSVGKIDFLSLEAEDLQEQGKSRVLSKKLI